MQDEQDEMKIEWCDNDDRAIMRTLSDCREGGFEFHSAIRRGQRIMIRFKRPVQIIAKCAIPDGMVDANG